MGTGRMLVTAVAVTAGVVAVGNQLGWIELVPGEHAVVARDRAPRRAGASSATAEDLRSELARLSAQEKRLAGEVQALRAESPAVPAAAPAESEIPEPEIPEPIRRAAAELGVSDAAIGAAVRADRAFRASPYGAHEAEIAALVALGEDGFRAVVALLKAGRGGIWFDRLFEATMAPGREALLLALSEDEDAMRRSGWSILTGLGFADTPEVRDYLLARLEREGREEDAGQFMSAAEALARLKEPRAAVFFEGKLARKGWSGVRGSLLNALGKIGGPDARRILLEYIRDPNSENPGSAVRALGQFDRVAAKEEARSLLSGPRRAFLKSYELRCLEEAAGSK